MTPVWGIVACLSLLCLTAMDCPLPHASNLNVHPGRGHPQSLLTPPPDRPRTAECGKTPVFFQTNDHKVALSNSVV